MDFDQVAELLRGRRDAYQAYRDASDDKLVLERVNAKNPAAATEKEVGEARAKATELLMVWHGTGEPTKTALEEFLSGHGLKLEDLRNL